MTKYYVDKNGNYIGGFDGSEPPKDSIEVSSPPEHGSYIWDGSKFNKPDKIITADQIKNEASRRILLICPEWKQRNLIAQASILLEKGPENWSVDDRKSWGDGKLIWERINSIRTKSNELEVELTNGNLSDDWLNDNYWL